MDNKMDIEKIVLSFLFHNPSLLFMAEMPVRASDFSNKINRFIYTAMANIYETSSEINQERIVLELKRSAIVEKEFFEAGGLARLYEIENIKHEAYEYSNIYGTMRKYVLFSSLHQQGFNTSDLYDPSLEPKKLEKMIEQLDAMSYVDILDHYRKKIASIEDKFENMIEKSGISAGEGLEELLQSLEEQPEMGMPVIGDIYNMVTRGARRKKVYINSAGSGTGKTRAAAGNAAKLGFPSYYDEEERRWIVTGMQCPVLLITTELEHVEVQTMFLAYVSGVNEEKILNNKYDTQEEKERVRIAMNIISNANNVYIEFIPNPSIESVSAKIRLYALQKDVEYVFYDYIHVSSATYTNKKDMRDDVWLLLFVDKLKQLANELDIHISTATQLNASSYEDREIKNESMIRGTRIVECLNTFLPLISGVHFNNVLTGKAKSEMICQSRGKPYAIRNLYRLSLGLKCLGVGVLLIRTWILGNEVH